MLARGYAIRYLDMKVDWTFGRSMKYFLLKLDKLKELSIDGDKYDDYEDDFDEKEFDLKPEDAKVADLSNLKVLKIHRLTDLKNIMNNSTNLINLIELSAIFSGNDEGNRNIFTDLICQQNKLQHLSYEESNDDFEFPNRDICNSVNFDLNTLKLVLSKIHQHNFISFLSAQATNLQILELEVTDTEAFNFPPRDISRDIKMNLKVLKFSHPVIHEQNFINFLRTQASCLQELELNCIESSRVFQMIFNSFKVLEKLTIDYDGSKTIFDDNFPQTLSLESLKYFHDKNQNGTEVESLMKLFPNIETLKCCDTMRATFTCDILTTLDVSEVYWPRITNLKMPNLKNLFIKKVDKCEDDYYWTYFTRNFKNVENITVEKVGYEDRDVLRFIKRLKVFRKLKTFKLRHGNAIDHDYKLDDNERVKVDEKFYKILIDTTTKTIKVSSYIVRECEREMRSLRRNFNDFNFFEFCFEELKMQQIIY
jgi:hypothetical protein